MRRMTHAHQPDRRGRDPVGLWLSASGNCPRLRRDERTGASERDRAGRQGQRELQALMRAINQESTRDSKEG
jgi:hypothetical protein